MHAGQGSQEPRRGEQVVWHAQYQACCDELAQWDAMAELGKACQDAGAPAGQPVEAGRLRLPGNQCTARRCGMLRAGQADCWVVVNAVLLMCRAGQVACAPS